MYAIVNGLKLFYHKEGSGRPVILLHGNGEDHTIFDVAIRDLAPLSGGVALMPRKTRLLVL